MAHAHYPTGLHTVSDANASIEMVDPDTATEWLARNDINRGVRSRKVAQYARDMINGAWRMTGEPVKFTADGRLLDGQHRMYAIIRARVTVPMLVVRGIEPDAQSYMDTGAARTPGDALALKGEEHANTLSAVARIGISIQRGQATGAKATAPSHADVFAWVNANPAIRESIAYGHDRYTRTGPLTASTLGYCHFRLAAIDEDQAMRFLDGVASGANLSVGSPQLAVRDRVFKIREEKRAVRAVDIVAIVFRAWNLWRKGKSTKSIITPQPGSTVPQPR